MSIVLDEFILNTRKQVQKGVPLYPETALYLLDRLQEALPLTWHSVVQPCNVYPPNEVLDHWVCTTHMIKYKTGSCPVQGKTTVEYLQQEVERLGESMWKYIDKCVELEKRLGGKSANPPKEPSWAKGLRSARERGKLGGRPPKHDAEKIRLVKAMHQEGIFSPQEIADYAGISVSTLYRLLKKEA